MKRGQKSLQHVRSMRIGRNERKLSQKKYWQGMKERKGEKTAVRSRTSELLEFTCNSRLDALLDLLNRCLGWMPIIFVSSYLIL